MVKSAALSPTRIHFEHKYLAEAARLSQGRATPALLHFDEERFILVMEWLAPHVTLRAGLQTCDYPAAPKVRRLRRPICFPPTLCLSFFVFVSVSVCRPPSFAARSVFSRSQSP